MLGQERRIDSSEMDWDPWELGSVVVDRIPDRFPSPAEKARDVDFIGLPRRVLFSSNEFRLHSLVPKKGRKLEKAKWRIAGIVIWLYQENSFHFRLGHLLTFSLYKVVSDLESSEAGEFPFVNYSFPSSLSFTKSTFPVLLNSL